MPLQLRPSPSIPASWRRWAWAALTLAVTVIVLRELPHWRRPPGAEASQVPAQPAPADGGSARAAAARIELPAELWDGVRDDTVFRGAEHEAFYRLLSQLSAASPQAIRNASQGPTGFLPLYQQTESYRGQIVTIQGVARRALVVKAEKNDFGIEKLFQVWIRPGDTTAGPLVVYCLDLPPNFPLGHDIEAPVELEALVFKRWAYRATDGTRTAPLLLARTLRWEPSRSLAGEPDTPNWLLITAGAAVISASAVFWIWFTGPRRRKTRHAEMPTP